MAISKVEEHEYGVYVWYTSDGRRVEDQDGNVMNIPARRGDMHAINKLQEAARHYGVPDGHAEFIGGARPITEAEYENQKERQAAGLVPDPLDYKAVEEELKYARRFD